MNLRWNLFEKLFKDGTFEINKWNNDDNNENNNKIKECGQ